MVNGLEVEVEIEGGVDGTDYNGSSICRAVVVATAAAAAAHFGISKTVVA